MKKIKPMLAPYTPPDPLRTEEADQNLPKPKDRLLYLVSLFTIVAAFFIAGLLLYWRLEPSKVYSVTDHKIEVLNENKTVKKGEEVQLRFSFCKLLEIDGTVQRNFLNKSVVLNGPALPENVGKACLNDLKVPVPMPPQIAPGTYRIQYVARYHINPIKEVEETFYSEEFTVTN